LNFRSEKGMAFSKSFVKQNQRPPRTGEWGRVGEPRRKKKAQGAEETVTNEPGIPCPRAPKTEKKEKNRRGQGHRETRRPRSLKKKNKGR